MQMRCLPRHFNTIEYTDRATVIKKGDIEGERWWYLNIPEEISDMFPNLISYSYDYIELEEIHGAPLSYLFIGRTFNETNLQQLFNDLNRIHSCNDGCYSYNIYSNYVEKLNIRSLTLHKYYEEYSEVYNILEKYLNNYTREKRGINTVIHGDPVFTNIICDMTNNYKFVDMRGKLGDIYTICGDIFYDYAKVYQSLLGYDFILHEEEIDYEYLRGLQAYFKYHIINKFGVERIKDIEMITCSLLVTLLPLHNDENKCLKYYELAKGLL